MLRFQGYATPPEPYFGASPPRDSAGPAGMLARPTPLPPRAAHLPSIRLSSAQPQRQESTPVSPLPYRSENRSPATSIASSDREASPAPSRSSHTATTASYTWPKFQPGAAGSKPTLFVEYRNPVAAAASGRRVEVDFPPTQSRSTVPFHGERTFVKHAVSTPYPSLSVVTSNTRSSPEDIPQFTRPPPARKLESALPPPQVSGATARQFTPPGERELQNTFRRLELGAQGHGRRRHGGSPPYRYSSESESSSGRSPGAQGSIGMARHSSLDPEADDWMRHAQALDGGGSSAQYVCTWVDPKDIIHSKPCGYMSKKHLVKRHVESKHLQIKPITCEICGKGFAQRTNYSTHMNTHTGDTPHKCPYPNCEATFGDPARRHRHMKTVHNHVPSKRRTQSDHGSMLLDDVSEPEEEDST